MTDEIKNEMPERKTYIWADVDPCHSWRGEWNEFKEDLAYPETAARYTLASTVLPADKVRELLRSHIVTADILHNKQAGTLLREVFFALFSEGLDKP